MATMAPLKVDVKLCDSVIDAAQRARELARIGVDGVFTDFSNTGLAARTAYLRELGR